MLASTLTLEGAARRRWPALVVGAGPAGAVAAHQLARHGVAVLLVDKAAFPRWKVCGCCLNPWALATLRAAGIHDPRSGPGEVPLSAVQLAADGVTAQVRLKGWAALSRQALDTELVRLAVANGVQFLDNTRATLRQTGPDWCVVGLRQSNVEVEVEAGVVLGADGLSGSLVRGTGFFRTVVRAGSRLGAGAVAEDVPDFYRPNTVFMACGRGGYLGLVRLEDGRVSLAMALDPARLQNGAGLGVVAAELLLEACWPSIPGVERLAWRGTPLLTRQTSPVAADRVFLLGDAAGYVEPFTGEGMAWAVASAVALAPLAAAATRCWRPELPRRWVQMHRRLLRGRRRVCQATATVLRAPPLLHVLVEAVRRWPGLAAPFIRYWSHGKL